MIGARNTVQDAKGASSGEQIAQHCSARADCARPACMAAGCEVWLLLGEGVFALVAGGACWRLFTKDIPEKPSLAATSYFVAVIVLLALVLRITPGHGAGMR